MARAVARKAAASRGDGVSCELARPRGLRAQLTRDAEPDGRGVGTGPLREQPRHARQHVVGGIGVADPLTERGEHLVGRRAAAVDDAIGEPPRAIADRHERHGQHHGGGEGCGRVPGRADQCARPAHHDDVHE